MKNKPNFLIVGAAKCGTTSLFEYLRRHPDVYMPPCKEISYFTGRQDKRSISYDEYLSYFSMATQQKRIGEASGAYLYPAHIPKKIARKLGDNLKIIMILRNPVDMSYALWGQNKRDGYEHLPFEDAIEQEHSRMNSLSFRKNVKTWLYQYAYIARATYAPQVESYLKIFGKDRVKVLIFEEFFQNLTYSLSELYGFLEIDPTFTITEFRKYNESGGVHSTLLQKFHSEKHLLTKPIQRFVPFLMRRVIINWIYKINSRPEKRPELHKETKAHLRETFKPGIIQMETILNKRLSSLWV